MSSRRANGEGTLSKRKDGRWEAAAYLGTVGGKVRRIRVYARTRNEAHAKLTERLADAGRGVPIADRTWKISEYLDHWLTNNTTLRPATRELYEAAIRNHVKPMMGSLTLERLTVPVLQQLLDQQRVAGKSVRTVQLIRTILSAALTRAMRDELVTRNVARLVVLEQSDREEVIPWTAEESRRFLAFARDHPLYPAFLMLMVYGIRRGEALGLRWSDIDWDNGIIHIRQQLQQIGNHLKVGPVKTSAGRRNLPLLPIIRDALAKLREQPDRALQPDNPDMEMIDGTEVDVALLIRTGSSNGTDSTRDLTTDEITDIVFLGRNGSPLWPRNFVRTFHRLCRLAGVRRIKPHYLRHGTATLLKNLGVQPRDAQLILGHAHISTTMQIYQHADLAAQQAALDRVGRVLLDDGDGSGSRQQLPSAANFVDKSTSFTSGGPGGARTHDTLLKSIIRLGRDPTLTSVFRQLRARTNTLILGRVAVKTYRQRCEPYNDDLVLSEWIPIRTALITFAAPPLLPPIPYPEVSHVPTTRSDKVRKP
ncbi:tyrosine-type recombinase/integrase [Nocardia farcinica]|uniref:tyrosine-type recombinase/integrase n=1 Tax=Nocardia farcinica TaxID=37329 RepID=UPI002455AFC4|nr:site-specific integrase [Nocardia farcinica]